ncbi:MAG: hypothetical protein KAI79_04710 [Bacteroidales bacterium]|nr:hypothetical protein [Bacteroidales bacterium]
MENFFKQFVYTGVGLVSQSVEKAKVLVDKLVDEGKVSSDEGKKIFDEFSKNTDTKKDELETQFSSLIEKVVKSFKFATNQDMSGLSNRVTVLEAVLANKKDAEKSAVVEKAPAKKTTRTKKTTTKKESGSKGSDK